MFLVKHWARRRALNEPGNLRNFPNSYTWCHLVIAYLQARTPPVVPVLTALSGGKWVDLLAADGLHLRDDDLDALLLTLEAALGSNLHLDLYSGSRQKAHHPSSHSPARDPATPRFPPCQGNGSVAVLATPSCPSELTATLRFDPL